MKEGVGSKMVLYFVDLVLFCSEFAYTLGIFMGNNIIAESEEIRPDYCLILSNLAFNVVGPIPLWRLALGVL